MLINSIHFKRICLADARALCLRAGLFCVLWLGLIGVSAVTASAATRTWDGGGTNAFWDTVTNWNNDALPANGDTVAFGTAFTSGSTINLNGNRTANTLTISTLSGFAITNSTLTLSSGDITRSDIAGTEADHTITSAIALGANGNWNIAGSGSLIASGVISGARTLTKNGTGALILSGNNTFSGTMRLLAGTLGIGHDNALGTGLFDFDKNTTMYAFGGARTIGNSLKSHENITISGSQDLTFTGTWDYANNLTLTLDNTGQTTFSGDVTGNNILNKAGSGTLVLSGSNDFDDVNVNAGVLNIRSSNALDVGAKKTVVASGAALELQGGIAVGAEALELSGSGISSGGALRNISGNNSWAGAITLNAASTIASDAGTLTVSGNISGSTFAQTYSGAGDVTASGVISGSGGVTKSGSGTLTLSGANTFTGGLTIGAGTLLLGNDNRIADGNAVTLGGGRLSSGGYDEIVGTLTLTADSIIDLGSGSSVLNFANSSAVSWTGGTTLTITNWNGTWLTGGGTDQIFFGSTSGGLTAGQLAQIRFADPNGYYTPAAILSNGEVVPVPEPATVIAVVLVVGLVLYRERGNLRQLFGRLRFVRVHD